MYKIRTLLAALVLFSSIHANAQLEFHKWYFGNKAGINFTTTPPTAMTNSAMDCIDVSGVISDSLGNVLFYSNGMTVWNKNHAIMQNGSGLLGQSSGGQSATIVRKPGSSTIYYLFTMDYFGASNGLKYSIVDMSLNGGLGAVTAQKNVTLLAPASEQIVPIVHSNGVDIWILTHEWNNAVYKAFLLTASGISSTPVITTIGSVRQQQLGDPLSQQYGAQGQITVNAANNKIATAYTGSNLWELLDFDNSTGSLSHVRSFPNTNYDFAWGMEFSADGSKVYLTGLTSTYLYQFDITSNNTATIAASAVNVGPINGPFGAYKTGYMQRGPDDKIYIAVYNDTHLGVINNPNLSGTACNAVDVGFNLAGKTSSAGLVDKILVTRECIRDSSILGNDTSACLGDSITLVAPAGASYRWSNDSTTSSLVVRMPGTYSVTVTEFGSCTITDAINVNFNGQAPTLNLGVDRVFCNGTPISVTLNAGQNAQWSTGANAQQITVTQAGVYWAEISSACGNRRDSVVISQGVSPTVNLGNDTAFCSTQSYMIDATQAGSSYLWSTGAITPSITVSNSGTYSVTVTNSSGCTGSDAFNLALSPPLTGLFQVTQPSCGNNNGILTCTNINGVSPINVQWNLNGNNVGNTYQINGLGSGTYYFNATDANGCTIDTQFTLTNIIGNGNVPLSTTDDTLCSGTTTTICAPAGFNTYQWNTGATTQCIDTRQAGNYYVTVTDAGNCTASSSALPIATFPLPPVSVTVKGDTLTSFNAVSYQWYFNGVLIEGATSSQYVATQNGSYVLVITDVNGCAASSNGISIIRTGVGTIVEKDFIVYPNPSNLSGWFVQVDDSMIGSRAEVYDYAGKLMYIDVLINSKTQIDFNAASGVYVLKLTNGINTISKKIIKL